MRSVVESGPPRLLEWVDVFGAGEPEGSRRQDRREQQLRSRTISVLALDPEPGSLVFGLYEVEGDCERARFERAVSIRPSSVCRGAAAGSRDQAIGSLREAVLVACRLTQPFGKLDAVACVVRGDFARNAIEAAAEWFSGVPILSVSPGDVAGEHDSVNTGIRLARHVFDQFP
jgi:hypothetical protein